MMKMDDDMKEMPSGQHDHSMMHMKHDMSTMPEMKMRGLKTVLIMIIR